MTHLVDKQDGDEGQGELDPGAPGEIIERAAPGGGQVHRAIIVPIENGDDVDSEKGQDKQHDIECRYAQLGAGIDS